jgi:superfamily II DNA or RNA helicase
LFRGYNFSPAYRARRWDGKYRAYNIKANLLPIGLVKDLIAWFVSQKTTFQLEGFRDQELFEPLDEEQYKNQIKENMAHAPFEIREYQDRAVRAALSNHKGILLSCTSSGKSLMLFNIIKSIRKQNFKNILLIVPNIMLVDQMYDDFESYGWQNLDKEVERLGGGHEAYFDRPVLISTWQSLQNKEADFFEKFDALFIDECHGSRADVLAKLAKQCVNARFKIGTTGTLPTEKSDLLKIRSVLGDVIFELKSKELIDVGVLTKIQIANIIAKYPADFVKMNKSRSYPEEVKMVEEYEDRNKVLKLIIDHTDQKHNILLLVNHLKHVKLLQEWIEKEYPDKKVSIITGSVSGNERSEIRKGIEEEDGTILLATYATMSTGVNMPKLHDVILYSNSKSKIKVLQSIGRGLRKHKTKNQIVLYDVADDLSYQTRTGRVVDNYLMKHWKERMTYYKEQEFPIITTTINI